MGLQLAQNRKELQWRAPHGDGPEPHAHQREVLHNKGRRLVTRAATAAATTTTTTTTIATAATTGFFSFSLRFQLIMGVAVAVFTFSAFPPAPRHPMQE